MVAATTAAGVTADTANCIQTIWSKLMVPLLDADTKVCGLSKNHQWRTETMWWNEQVYKAIQEKRAQFKDYKALKKGGKMAEAKEAETTYNDAKCVAKHPVWLQRLEAEKEEFATVSPDGDGVFHIAKKNHNVIGENCVYNNVVERALTDYDKMKAWVEHC